MLDKSLIGKIVKLNTDVLWKTACPNPDIYIGMIGIVEGIESSWIGMTCSYYYKVYMDSGDTLSLNREEFEVLD